MKKDHMFYDPFIEHDELQKKFRKMDEDNKRYWTTKLKYEIVSPGFSREGDDSSLSFTIKKSGDIDIRVSTYFDTKKTDSRKCELGHFHPIIKRDTHYYDLLYMKRDEAIALRDFLNERLK